MKRSAKRSERDRFARRGGGVLLVAAVLLLHPPGSAVAAEAPVERGAYVFKAAGCAGCHTDVKGKGPPLAGGRELPTPFGTFYGPNITPDPDHGLGRWTLTDFRRALREGLSPKRAPYYPSFPYTSFTGMTDEDIDALWRYLRSVPAVARPNKPHRVGFPFNLRMLLRPWQWLFFEPGRGTATRAGDELWNRGAYLVNALGHCGECHSPRGSLGQVDPGRALGGNPHGPDNKKVPNITPDRDNGIGAWSVDDIVTYLSLGMDPEGDFVGGPMAEVIENSTQNLGEADQRAIAHYLKNIPARPGAPKDSAATRTSVVSTAAN